MTKFFSKLMLATLGLTLTAGTWSAAMACPRGGSGGGHYSYSAPRYNYRPVHVQPRPVYAPRPQVQFAPQQQVQFSQQQQFQPQQFQPQQVQQQPSQPLQALGGGATQVSGQQFQPTGGQQGATFAGGQQPQVSGQQVQQVGGQQAIGNQGAGQNPSQGTQQVQFASQPQQQQGGGVPAPSAPSQPAGQPQVNNAPAAQNNGAAQAQLSAQQSALQALMAFGEEDAEASTSTTPDVQGEVSFHVGSWTAVLANNVTVQLVLQADGAFRWTANANGKASSFDGTYNLNGGSLQLNRANDSQQLAGTIVRTNNGGFNFKLQGKTDAGLNFARN